MDKQNLNDLEIEQEKKAKKREKKKKPEMKINGASVKKLDRIIKHKLKH